MVGSFVILLFHDARMQLSRLCCVPLYPELLLDGAMLLYEVVSKYSSND